MKQTELELIEQTRPTDHEQEIKQRGLLSQQCLEEENRRFKGSRGISQNNRSAGFIPAFRDSTTGTCIISRFADGSPAPVHVLDGLPHAWVTRYDAEGHVTAVRKGIISGFLRGLSFYTREEAARCA